MARATEAGKKAITLEREMKVTKTGTKPEDREWRGTCRSCKSEATATEGEMKHITYNQREGGSFSWEKCPVCNAGGASGFGGMLFYPRCVGNHEVGSASTQG